VASVSNLSHTWFSC